MDNEDGSDENLEEDTPASNNKRVTFAPLVIVLNSDQSQTNLRITESISAESPESSDSVSSSPSNSSSDDFIPINPQILFQSRGNGTPQPIGGTKPSHANEKCNNKSEAFYKVEETTNESAESSSQSSDITCESVTEHMLPTLSPAIQVMEWPQGLDSNGLSASHLCTVKKGSAASDDSLLSMEVDLFKSEERPNLDRTRDIGEDVKYGEKGKVDEPVNSVSKAHQDDTNAEDLGDSSTAKFQSDKFATSDLPIALPKKKKSSSPLHHCPDCCPALRCCSKWPGCSFKWFIQPSCSINCLSWLGGCCKSPICHCKCPVWSTCCAKHKS